jgi:CubicO group peptidase (beta-lactamase class C family)
VILMNGLRTVIIVAALAPIGAGSAAAQQREPWPGYDAYVNAALATWKVPGAAIAIVRNDSLIYARGYGVRELGKRDAVTERTLFAIGSSSKAFTAAGLAMLVDEGKIRWDDAATKYLPNLQLHDAYATRELTIRDLLSHRSGLARGDLLWYGSDLDRDEILRRARFLEPSWSFRSRFGYQNLMYLAAGQVNARVANTTWDDFITTRIFRPLGMTSSNTTTRALASQRDVASPHAEIDDTVRVIPWRNIDNIAPAGSINSHVVDMAQWVRLQLGKGKYGGRQLITSAQVEEMHTPHTIIRQDAVFRMMFPNVNFFEYGLGWFLQDYRGKKVVHHGGNIDGMSALVTMIPEDNFGMVILTNMNGSALPSVLMYKTFDLHLKAPPKDWSADRRVAYEGQVRQGREAQKRLEAQRVSGTKPSLPLAEYAGVYADSMYGEARVSEAGGKLVLTRGPAFVGDLEHWHFDTFRTTWRARSLGRMFVSFRLGASGKAEELAMDLGGAPTTFKRRPEVADTTAGVTLAAADLRKYVGNFQSAAPPVVITVEEVGGRLRATVPGQPAFTMVPVTVTRFKLVGPNVPAGFFLVYAMDGSAVKTITLEQPAPRPPLTLTPAK